MAGHVAYRICCARSELSLSADPCFVQALALSGAVMGGYSIKVVRSKTAIVPVNASLLPRTEEEHERCKRTVYVTNIDLGVEVWLCCAALLWFQLLTCFRRRSLRRSAASSRRCVAQ